MKGSWSHRRIIQYKFGGLDFLLRFECDGFMDGKERTIKREEGPNSLLDALQTASIGSSITPAGSEGIEIKEGSRSVSQEDIFEVKTRSILSEFTRAEIMPKLWLTQAPKLIIGFHLRGLFVDIRIEEVKEDIAKWEKENEESLRKLASLVHDLVELAKTSRSRLEVCHATDGCLEIRRPRNETPGALPSEMRESWTGRHKPGEEARETDTVGELPLEDEETSEDDFAYLRDEISDNDSDGSSKDFTACSADDCGYCGRCRY